ncbi:hypothetical protein [Botryobacter ruber]|uniref:hypothetical protein n=1 Tax=Botryobacter ruber TaxID=2171629 RepID=UPI000E0AC937|nr:hypothetical protein [Botryobacter ruber]
MKQVYFQNSFICISHDRQAQLGIAKWNGHLQGAELRETFLLCLDLIDRYSLTRWLADDRLMQAIEPTDLEWTLQVFIPRLAESSLLRMARLPSQYEENNEAVELMINKGQNYTVDLVHRTFQEEQEAMEWLLGPL